MAASDLILLLVAVGSLYAVKAFDVLAMVREMGSRRMAVQLGGFSVGLMVGPAVASALTGAFSGLAALSTTNLTGLTNIDPQTMLVIGLAFIAVAILSRVRAEDTD